MCLICHVLSAFLISVTNHEHHRRDSSAWHSNQSNEEGKYEDDDNDDDKEEEVETDEETKEDSNKYCVILMSLLQGLEVNQTKLAHHKHHKLWMNEWPSPFSLIECDHGWSKTQEKRRRRSKKKVCSLQEKPELLLSLSSANYRHMTLKAWEVTLNTLRTSLSAESLIVLASDTRAKLRTRTLFLRPWDHNDPTVHGAGTGEQ